MFTRVIGLAALIASGQVLAQDSVYVPDNKALVGHCNGIPFGVFEVHPFSPNQKYQTLITWQQMAKLSRPFIQEIGFAACYTGVHRFASIKIRMDQIASASLASEFTKNLTQNAVTVLESRHYYWHSTQGTWSRIGLQKPFPLSTGKNLVIEIEVRGAVFLSPSFGTSRTALGSFREADKLPRLYAIDWKTSPPSRGVRSSFGLKIELSARVSALGRFGMGCKGSGQNFPSLGLSGKASPGGTVVVSLGGGLPENPAFLAIGLDNKPPYPLPLGTGCSLYQSVDAGIHVTSDKQGNAALPLPLPLIPALRDQRIYTQFFQIELTPKIGLRASNYGRILIGR